jgi:uridylate kinase
MKEGNKKWVIILGGSRIAPKDKEIDYDFIEKFEDLIENHPSHRFVVVTGGGTTARKYISALKKLGKKTKTQSKAGIAVTRFHALFLSRIFGAKANDPKKIPKNMKKVKSLLAKNQVVFCGALRWDKNKTSDGTSADLAGFLKAPFINLTNIRGLYTSNPKTNKKAKFIKKISWKKFYNMASKIKFKAGQHFVLDQDAAETIMEKKIPTYIVGSLEDVDKIISNKKGLKGTVIRG